MLAYVCDPAADAQPAAHPTLNIHVVALADPRGNLRGL